MQVDEDGDRRDLATTATQGVTNETKDPVTLSGNADSSFKSGHECSPGPDRVDAVHPNPGSHEAVGSSPHSPQKPNSNETNTSQHKQSIATHADDNKTMSVACTCNQSNSWNFWRSPAGAEKLAYDANMKALAVLQSKIDKLEVSKSKWKAWYYMVLERESVAKLDLQTAKQLEATQRQSNIDLRKELKEVRDDYVAIRKALQPVNNRQPGDVIDDFTLVKTHVWDFCREFTDHISDVCKLDTYLPSSAPSGKLVAALQPAATALLPAPGQGKPLYDSFLEFAFRHCMSGILLSTIFSKFHPIVHGCWEDTDDSRVHRMYRQVQKAEGQISAAKWRAQTFQAIGASIDAKLKSGSAPSGPVITREDAVAQNFARIVAESFGNIITFSTPQSWVIADGTEEFKKIWEIGRAAYSWNCNSRMNFLPCEFAIALESSKTPTKYDEVTMKLPVRVKPPKNGQILLAYGLGVKVYSIDEERSTWSEKIDVLTADDYFQKMSH